LPMAKFLTSRIGGQSINILGWPSLRPSQSPSFSSVSVCRPLLPVPLPLYHQWIHVSNELMNSVNCNWQEWGSQETHLLGVPACIELLKLLLNYPGLSEFQQFDFIERIYIHNGPPNDIPFIFFDLYKSNSLSRPASADIRRKKRTDINFWQHQYVLARTKYHEWIKNRSTTSEGHESEWDENYLIAYRWGIVHIEVRILICMFRHSAHFGVLTDFWNAHQETVVKCRLSCNGQMQLCSRRQEVAESCSWSFVGLFYFDSTALFTAGRKGL
jgi:hypothetical protein